MKKLFSAAIITAALIGTSACGSQTVATDAAVTATAAASASATGTQEATPTPTRQASTTLQVASEIAGARKMFLQAANDWEDNACLNVIGSGQTGTRAVDCVAAKSVISTSGAAIVTYLDMTEPWSPEVADLAENTRKYVDQASGVAKPASTSSPSTLELSISLAV